jgi:hypothetical protein
VRALRLSEKTVYLGRRSALMIEIASSSACTSAENTEASCGRVAERAVAPHTAAATTPALVLEPLVYIYDESLGIVLRVVLKTLDSTHW